ncbi:Crp/Fnr family transcriptional regulator [Listeria booriae]|uniref:Crp/Fnr family transcriptional regulator n=1 Tax=Listeria booriae TaxID=1552123 RepID=UPI00162A33F1|nr:Crp/Fnr family transcriptional regulator [Listeria booriae]MBC1919897.1 Crp/Fnr family transcriptional regulator [Listeria booriae]
MTYLEVMNENTSFPEGQFKEYLLDDTTYTIPFETICLEPKEIIIKEQQEIDQMYVIASGVVIEKQNENIIHFLGKNELIGLGAITGRENATTTSMTLTKTKLYKIAAKDILEKLRGRHYGMGILADVLNTRITSLGNRLSTNKSNSEKVLQAIIKLASMYGEQDENKIRVTKYFTKQMIANYLHISYSSVASIYKKLSEKKSSTTNCMAQSSI